MKVLCFGSLNIDYTYKVDHFVKKGETLSAESLQVFCGGKGLNQSIALAKAGVDTCHAGAVGEDGVFLLEELQKAKVDTGCVAVRQDVRTGNAIIQNDREGDNCILLYGGANQAITKEQVDTVLEHFVSGDFLMLQNEINEIPYIMEQAHRKGMKIVLNPSPMNSQITPAILEKATWLFVNEVEAEQLCGASEPGVCLQRLGRMCSGGSVILTLGSAGSCYGGPEGTFEQPAFPVSVVDTTAAGDTFTGYFLADILRNGDPASALRMAAKAAALAVTRKGAFDSIPWLNEVEAAQM